MVGGGGGEERAVGGEVERGDGFGVHAMNGGGLERGDEREREGEIGRAHV